MCLDFKPTKAPTKKVNKKNGHYIAAYIISKKHSEVTRNKNIKTTRKTDAYQGNPLQSYKMLTRI